MQQKQKILLGEWLSLKFFVLSWNIKMCSNLSQMFQNARKVKTV